MTSPRWLSDHEQCAWRGYLTMTSQLNAQLNRQLQADSGLSLADFEVLVNLTDHGDQRVRVSELARALQWEKSRLSHHLGRMAERGLIERVNCPSDARGTFIGLTEQGRKAIEQAAPGHVEAVRELFLDQLTAEQLHMLRDVSTRVLARLEGADT